jgi:hypothetical protein
MRCSNCGEKIHPYAQLNENEIAKQQELYAESLGTYCKACLQAVLELADETKDFLTGYDHEQ